MLDKLFKRSSKGAGKKDLRSTFLVSVKVKGKGVPGTSINTFYIKEEFEKLDDQLVLREARDRNLDPLGIVSLSKVPSTFRSALGPTEEEEVR